MDQKVRDRLEEITARLAGLPGFDFELNVTLDRGGEYPHAVFYIGRDPTRHGLNIFRVSDPAYQYPKVREFLVHSAEDVNYLCQQVEMECARANEFHRKYQRALSESERRDDHVRAMEDQLRTVVTLARELEEQLAYERLPWYQKLRKITG